MKFIKRNRWHVVVGGLYDFRECPDCAAVVYGDRGQHNHAQAHERLDEDLFGPELVDAGGYIANDGPVGELLRGGREGEE